MQIENGNYAAKPTGLAVGGEHQNGCLIVSMEFEMEGGAKISNTFWLTTKDGAMNTRTIQTLKEVFGWDGSDPFWFEDSLTLREIPVELVIENETFTGNDGVERTAPKVKWVNAPGGAGGVKIANGDRKTLLAKYGAKLRAVSGGAPAPARSAPPAAKPAAPAAPAAEPSDMEACWNELFSRMMYTGKPGSKVKRSAVEAKWFEILKELHGEKDPNEFTPAEWGAVLVAVNTVDEIPY